MDRQVSRNLVTQGSAPALGAASLLVGLLIFTGLYLSGRYNYLLLLSLAELFAVAVALAIFMLTWNSRRYFDRGFFPFIGLAYLFVGIFNLLHFLAYREMNIFCGYDAGLTAQLWTAGRYLQSVSMLAAPSFINRKLNYGVLLVVYTAAATALLVAVFSGHFPESYREASGVTSFKTVSEYLVTGIFLGAAVHLYRKRASLGKSVWTLLLCSLAVTVGLEALVIISPDGDGLTTFTGHFLLIISFYLAYRAIVVNGLAKPYDLLFRDLKHHEEALHNERNFISAVLDTAGALVVVLKPDGTFARFNRTAEQITGYTADEVKGKHFWDIFLLPEESAAVRGVFDRLAAGEFPNTHENYWLTKHGGRRLIDWANTVLLDSAGRVEYVISTGIDITERREAEERRASYLQRLHTLIRVSAEVLSETTLSGLLQRVVDAARELTDAKLGIAGHGYQEGAFTVRVSSRASDIPPCPPKEAFSVQKGGVYFELVKGKDSLRLSEQELTRHPAWWGLPEGHVPLKGLLGARLKGVDDQVSGIIMVSHKGEGEFTAEDEVLLAQLAALASLGLKHIEAKQAVEAGYTQLQAIVTSMNDGLIIVDLDGTVRSMNPSALHFHGFRNEEEARIPLEQVARIIELRTPDGNPLAFGQWPLVRALKGEAVFHQELVVRRRNSGEEWIGRFSAAPVVNSRGEIILAITTLQDVTAQKQLENELKRHRDNLEELVQKRTAALTASNEQLAYEINQRIETEAEHARLVAAIESAAEAIVVTDTRGFVQYVNPAFERITGYARDEVVGGDLHVLDSGRQDEAFYRTLREALHKDTTWSGQLINKRKDGSIYYEECTISPIKSASGDVINYVYVKRDVTEKLRLESIAEAVNVMDNIGYIFSGIRHEMGNPINSMKMALRVLKANIGSYSSETISEYLERSLGELSRIEYLLKSLKSFTMYETPELQSVELRSFMDKLLPLVRDDFSKRGVSVTLSLAPGAERCLADPRALQQVLLNIFTNAADACMGRPRSEIAITITADSGIILLKIADTGCGMTEEQQRDLFKPFRTSKEQGTGLGLVIAKRMLAMMGGTIQVTSTRGEGTVVEITLPESLSGSRQP
ncbi:MAG: MASE3 domain-containing protein [Nitrospirota bacterium]